ISPDISMFVPMKNEVVKEKDVFEKYGVPPEKVIDLMGLMGDSSDNVPGVPGVGPTTAQKLIGEHGTLEGVYENLDGMKKSKMKERLAENKEMAFLSRDLIRLKYDVDVPAELSGYLPQDPDDEKLNELYTRLGFESMVKIESKAIPVPTDGFKLVQTTEDLQEVVNHFQKAKLMVMDTETTSLDVARAALVGISLCSDLDSAWYIPVGHFTEDDTLAEGQLQKNIVLEALRPFFESADLPKLGHNIKYDYSVLKKSCGITLQGPLYDSMIAAYLAEPGRRSLKLDELCLERDCALTSFDQVVEDPKKENCFAYVSLDKACEYSCEDVYGALLLWQDYEPLLKELKQFELFLDVETPLIPILAEMELAGITVSEPVLDSLEEEFQQELDELQEEIHELAGYSFNIHSPKQLGVLLFDELELPHGRKTK
ncbi:MAG: DNA polymerase I, partial [Desulfocapsa sp.]|nr:DNA polymerase I [Desulfocapsa sp.]